MREGEDVGDHAEAVDERREHRSAVRDKHRARVHCCICRAIPVLAAASSGVGERQGAFKEAQTKMGARFGTILQ